MNTLRDPIPESYTTQLERKEAWWLNIAPRLPPLRPRRNVKPITVEDMVQALTVKDWGTADEPGEAFWTMRAMMSQTERNFRIAQAVGDFLSAEADPLPSFLCDLWSRQVFRGMCMRSLMSKAVADSWTPPELVNEVTAARKQLFTQLLRHWPEMMRWMCQDVEVLVGKNDNGDMGGMTFKSPLAHAVSPGRKPEYQPWDGAIDVILATHPLEGMDPQVRQDTYGSYASKHSGLRAQVMGDQAESELQVFRDRQHDRVSPFVTLVEQGDLEGFNRLVNDIGFDPLARDPYGQTLYHVSVASLRTQRCVSKGGYQKFVGYNSAIWEEKSPVEVQAEFDRLLIFWKRFDELGIDFMAPSAPKAPPRMSKATGRPVKSTRNNPGWPKRAAWPGETPSQMIQRHIDEKEIPEMALAVIRNHLLTIKPQQPEPTSTKRRARSRA